MKVIYVGLDLDDTHYHGSTLDKDTGDVITFQCRPTLAGLLKQLAKLSNTFPGFDKLTQPDGTKRGPLFTPQPCSIRRTHSS
jgi:hypothetical protein